MATAARQAVVPPDVVRFVGAIFREDDLVLTRPVEAWTEDGEKHSRVIYRGIQYHWADKLAGDPALWRALLALAEREKANLFVGVCPRFGGGQRFDLAWQVRVVRVLWADLDHCTPEEALARCEKAGLPRPSVIVRSGHGVHLYWLLAEPFLIDDAGDPPPAYREFIDQGKGKKKKVRRYLLDPATGAKDYRLPGLTAKAKRLQQVVKGIAAAIGGDHTQDLSRILRWPGTLNRKDQRNGKEPVPCVLVECDPERRYSLALFEPFADKAPGAAEEKKAAEMRLPRRKLTPGRLNTLGDYINACSAAEDQSRADYRLCRWAAGQGLDREEVWGQVKDVSKFARRGRDYFDQTWEKAEARARLSVYRQAQRRAGAKAAPGTNGDGHGDDTPAGEGRQPGDGDTHLTDVGNAQRLVARHGQDLRYCFPWRQWLAWDDRRWAADQTGEAVRRVKDTQAALYRETAERMAALGGVGDDEERKRELAKLTHLLKHALAWEDARAIDRCLKLAASEPGVPVLPAQLDADPMVLNVLNGTVDLKTGRLREHRREDHLTKLAPVAYDPDAVCPLWERAVVRWMGGKVALVRYLQRVAGYCLTGDVGAQCLWFLHGSGANGKTTMMRTLMGLLGDYAWQAVPELLLQKKHEAHPTERADLFGRRLVATIEVEEGKRLALALMKLLTGGDEITARKCHQDFFKFAPTHKLFLVANHRPVIRGTDHGTWRRIKLVPFTVTIPEEEKDPDLLAKLQAEASGILAWCVAGCLAWQRDGFEEPEEVTQATTAYRAEQDEVAGFVAEVCFVHRDAKVQASVLYKRFVEWSGDDEMTQRAFTQAMEDRGFVSEPGTGNRKFYKGIGLPG
jgi:putative DNA primase/helicase